MNKPLLNKVKKFIRENPEKLNMHAFGRADGCGCIAHHAMAIRHNTSPANAFYRDWVAEAEDLLDLTPFERKSLFYVVNWPEEFSQPYREGTQEQKAETTIRRINHFMRTGK